MLHFLMLLNGPSALKMLLEAGLHMPAGLADIARFTARTLELIHNPASDHLLDGWLERGEDRL